MLLSQLYCCCFALFCPVHAISVNRLRWKRTAKEEGKKSLRGQNVKMYQRFSMLFSCLLSFGFIFVMSLLFNLIQILICHVFLFICFFFISVLLFFHLSSSFIWFWRPIVHNTIVIFTIHKISLKNINIRLKRLTLCFVPSVHLTSDERLSLCCTITPRHCTISRI